MKSPRNQCDTYAEALRWIAAGLTGSYGSAAALAAAVLREEDERDEHGGCAFCGRGQHHECDGCQCPCNWNYEEGRR